MTRTQALQSSLQRIWTLFRVVSRIASVMIFIMICYSLISDTINHRNSIAVDLSIYIFFGALLISVGNPIVNAVLILVGLMCYEAVTSLVSLPVDVRVILHGVPEFVVLY